MDDEFGRMEPAKTNKILFLNCYTGIAHFSGCHAAFAFCLVGASGAPDRLSANSILGLGQHSHCFTEE